MPEPTRVVFDVNVLVNAMIGPDSSYPVEKTRVSQGAAAKYIDALTEIVEYSGGAIIDPPRTVHEVHDFEDNLILDLVVDVDALILVTDDTDLTELSPWRGRPLLRPRKPYLSPRPRSSSASAPGRTVPSARPPKPWHWPSGKPAPPGSTT